jgi:AbrB family looped-hinge helix DNA binding protein
MSIRTTVTGKNQLTIPAALARELDIGPGTQVEWELTKERTLVLRPLLSRAELARQLQGKWRHLFGPEDDPIGDLIRERVEEDMD